jgi:ribose transport system substrate-binding protein
MHGRRTRFRLFPLGCLAVAVTALASGCASGSSGDAAASAGSAAGLAAATEAIASASAVPGFTLDAPAFELKKIAGKTIFSIPINSSVSAISGLDEKAAEIARQYGANWVEYTNQGTPSDWSAGINQAIAQRADAIFLEAVPVKAVAPALQKAKDAGIPVVLGQDLPMSDLDPSVLPLITNTVNRDYALVGKLEADWSIKQAKGAADILVLNAPDGDPAAPMVAAFTDEFNKNCPGCKMKMLNITQPQWASQMATSVAAAVRANPKLNAIVAFYDPMVSFVASGLQLAGKSGQIPVGTFNGTPAGLSMVQKNNGVVVMDIGESYDWAAYAIVDQLGRVLTGAPQVANGDEKVPLRVFTPENVAEAGTPPAANKGYGDAYVNGYRTLWNVG